MLNYLVDEFNKSSTANGAFAYKSTKSAVLDLFALGGAYRNRSDRDVVMLFSKAFAENPLLAMKTLFYLRDIRFGMGERLFFKLCLQHLAIHNQEALAKNLHLVSEFASWDDFWVLLETPLKNAVISLVDLQLNNDVLSETPSLLGKWMPSENTSSYKTKKYAKIIRQSLELSPRQYRKMLSSLRKKIDIVESKMSANQWSDIQYDKLPSKAGLNYRNAFFNRDGVRYGEFLEDLKQGKVTVNSSTLYPYEIVEKAIHDRWGYSDLSSEEVTLLDGMWNNLPDYIGDRKENSIAVVDVSGSMSGTPMNVAISLGIYLAERNKGTFHNHFFTFSERPQLVKVEGTNIVEKVLNMERANWGYSTNVESVFNKILDTAIKNKVSQDEMIDKVFIISDMAFNQASGGANAHIFKELARNYSANGYALPQLVFWNVNAFMSNTPFTMNDEGVMLVSGFSPTIFKNLLGSESINPYELMLEVIESERYSEVVV
jgi:hypothetical protein